MKVAIFGGTGFLGYDFVKECMKFNDIDFTVYSTNPKSMVNILRHDIDIQLINPEEIELLKLPADTDYIINYSHPFIARQGLTIRKQLKCFVKFVAAQRKHIPGIKLIHLSSMSVYEPFNKLGEYSESSRISPTKGDAYASSKVYIEKGLRALKHANDWQLHLRPTIVYGPYCRPWTDRIFSALRDKPLYFKNLEGKIQPVYCSDISRFVYQSIYNFKPGVFNIAGEETITWQTFIKHFEGIVPGGRLVFKEDIVPDELGPGVGRLKYFMINLKIIYKKLVKDPAFDRLAKPVADLLPKNFVQWARDVLFYGGLGTQISEPDISFLASSFYSRDSLVSLKKLNVEFSDFKFTRIDQTKSELAMYYKYRFTDTKIL